MKVSAGAAAVMTLLATFFWGSNFHATVVALSSMPPWTACLVRFLFAGLATFALLACREGLRWEVLSRNLGIFVALGLIGVAGFTGALFVGLQTASPVTGALIMATTPISANIIEALVRRELPAANRVIGMLVSLFGVFLVITNGEVLLGAAAIVPGDLIILAGSVGWAIYTVGVKSAVRDATPLETTCWTMLIGTAAIAIVAFLFETPWPAAVQGSAATYLAIVWMGIGGTILAYLFWNVGTVVRGAGRTAIFFNFVPIFAVLIDVIWGRLPGIYQLAGIAIAIFGVLVGQGALGAVASRAR